MMTLSQQLRRLIKESGMTVYRISKDAGINPAILGRFVNNQRDLTLGTADKIAKVLNLKLMKMESDHGKEKTVTERNQGI